MSTSRTTITLSPRTFRGPLTVQLHDTWHVGVGKAQGRYLDAVADRDADGLPYVPGRTLKGLLRDAGSSLEAWGHWPAGTVARLFGSGSQRDAEATTPGLIRVADARLPTELRAWLASPSPEAREQRAALFMEQFQTAIDADSGVAAEGSLRGMEWVVPLTLVGELAMAAGATADDVRRVREVLPMVRAIGAQKTRGQGRASLHWQETTA